MNLTVILGLLALAGGLSAQVAAPAGPVRPINEEKQRSLDLVQAMGLEKGMSVADVGTGLGNLLPFLSRAVGRIGRVFAEDTVDDFLAGAKQLADDLHLKNVVFIKGTESDPNLPKGQMDQVLVFDVYHSFSDSGKVLAAIHEALKPGGKLTIVEYYKTPEAMPNGRAMTRIRLDKPEVIKEIEANHFRLVSEREHVPGSQYMLTLERI